MRSGEKREGKKKEKERKLLKEKDEGVLISQTNSFHHHFIWNPYPSLYSMVGSRWCSFCGKDLHENGILRFRCLFMIMRIDMDTCSTYDLWNSGVTDPYIEKDVKTCDMS